MVALAGFIDCAVSQHLSLAEGRLELLATLCGNRLPALVRVRAVSVPEATLPHCPSRAAQFAGRAQQGKGAWAFGSLHGRWPSAAWTPSQWAAVGEGCALGPQAPAPGLSLGDAAQAGHSSCCQLSCDGLVCHGGHLGLLQHPRGHSCSEVTEEDPTEGRCSVSGDPAGAGIGTA